MRCNTCSTRGIIKISDKYGFDRIAPCPDCHGGHQHCCDGEDWCPTNDKGLKRDLFLD